MMSLTRKSTLGVVLSLLVVGLAAFVLVPQEGWAQTGTGSVSGIVRDAKQAVGPGADVTVTNEQTNVARKGVSNEVGVYKVAPLPIGQYRITVELAGFKKCWAPSEVKVRNPAFDITPAALVTALIAERGIIRHPDRTSIAGLFAA